MRGAGPPGSGDEGPLGEAGDGGGATENLFSTSIFRGKHWNGGNFVASRQICMRVLWPPPMVAHTYIQSYSYSSRKTE